jgi:hypothetical protein
MMAGLPLIGVGLFLLAVGGARHFVARPQPGKQSTAFDRGDFIASKILLGVGLALLTLGAAWTVVEMLS